MSFKKCVACGKKFNLCPKVSNQTYCSKLECQRERKKCWQREKRQSDPDYRDNQSRAQREWAKKNLNYWAEYRRAHPEYSERNRLLQLQRNKNRHTKPIAKMDASAQKNKVLSGIYSLTPLSAPLVAKMDEYIVEIKIISSTSSAINNCKETT